jgi:acyl-coenzyme A synthetase/AMP-(fatty) acid ligase
MTTPSSETAFLASGVSYQDVYALANSLREGLGKRDGVVCVCSGDKAVIAASVLAALAEGFSLVLPHATSESALRELHSAIGVSKAITEEPESVPAFLEPLRPERTGDSTFRPPLRTEPDQDFVYFFTGGSTAAPKIWPKTPRNLFSEAFYHSRKWGISSDDVILATVPPHHIYGFLFTVLIPFVSSASVVQEVLTFPEEIRKAMARYAPTLLVSVPVHYKMFQKSPISGHSPRLAFSSAGMLEEEDAACFYRQTGTRVMEIYGSTETGGIASRDRVFGDAVFAPFEPLDWKILQDQLVVRSPFISPTCARDAEGFFQTGDRASAAAEQGFVLLGRADGVIKVGGTRIDTGEVQDKLRRIPGVDDAVVLAVPLENGRGNEIRALVQARTDIRTLREAAKGVLEPLAVPRKMRLVERIPTTSTGKYDREEVERLLADRSTPLRPGGPS